MREGEKRMEVRRRGGEEKRGEETRKGEKRMEV